MWIAFLNHLVIKNSSLLLPNSQPAHKIIKCFPLLLFSLVENICQGSEVFLFHIYAVSEVLLGSEVFLFCLYAVSYYFPWCKPKWLIGFEFLVHLSVAVMHVSVCGLLCPQQVYNVWVWSPVFLSDASRFSLDIKQSHRGQVQYHSVGSCRISDFSSSLNLCFFSQVSWTDSSSGICLICTALFTHTNTHAYMIIIHTEKCSLCIASPSLQMFTGRPLETLWLGGNEN